MRPRCGIIVALAFVLSPIWSRAQPLADRLPNDTLIYAGWTGAADLGPGYAGSHFKAVIDSSDFSQLLNEFIPAVLDKISASDPEAAQVLPIVRAIGLPMWRHPSAFYFGGIEFAGGQPNPRVALLCDAGPDAPKLVATLNDLLAKAGRAPVPVAVREKGGLVTLTIGKMSTAFDVVAGNSPAAVAPQKLSDDAKFKAAMAQTVKDPTIAFYMNFEGLLEGVSQIIQQQAPPEVQQMFPKVRDALGLAGLKQIAVAGGFDGKDWAESAFISAPSPRTGILKLADGKPLSADVLKVIPKTAVQASAAKFDLAGLVGAIRDGITRFDANAGQQVDQVIGQINGMLGMDLQKDLFGSLGDEWVVYSDPATGGYGFAGYVLVNRVPDAAKAEEVFTKVETLINMLVANNMPEKDVHVAFQARKVGDLNLHYLAVPLITPTWAVKDGNLYVALYPQAVQSAAEFVARKGPSIAENPAFEATRARLGNVKASAFEFSDLERQTPVNYGAWLALSRIVGIGDIFGIKAPIFVMPPMGALMANMGPAGSVSWADDAGFHARSICPFPGSTVLGTDPISAYMSTAPLMSVGIMLPALQKARAQATSVKSMSNLRQIGISAIMYANDHKGALPPDLGSLLPYAIDARPFISPQSGKQAPPNWGTMGDADKAAWINENADYVLVIKNKKMTQVQNPVETPLAHEKFELSQGQTAVVFVDGHAEMLPTFIAQQRVDAAKQPDAPK